MPALLFAQRYNITTYSVNRGLPQAQVHDIEQTEDGYIWMATYGGGLARFDGSNFVNYNTDDGLKNNLVEDLFVDSRDDLWVATDQGGVAQFQGDSLIYPIKNDSLNAYSVGTITESKDGSIWFGTYEGGIFVLKEGSIRRFTQKDGLPSNIIWELFQQSDGTMLVATANGMSVYDGEQFTNYDKSDGLASNDVYNFAEITPNELWIATANGISIWDGNQFDKMPLNGSKQPHVVYDILQSSKGTIWVATRDNGVYRQKGEGFEQLTEKNGLSSNFIYTLFEDSDNNIWIGTDEDGANLYRESGFILYDDKSGLSNDEILSVHKNQDGTVWMGSTTGIHSYQNGSFNKYGLPKQNHRMNIWNIISLPNGNKLVAMPDSTLMEFDGEAFHNFSATHNLKKLFIYDLTIDDDKVLWIASNTGLYSLNLETDEINHITEEDGLANKRVFHVYEDHLGRKWVGTYYGLSLVKDGEIRSFNVDDGLVHSQVNYVTEDQKNNLWIGTRGGVSVFRNIRDGKPQRIDNFAEEEGMVLLNTHFLWFDNEGNLWQGTNGGLQKLDVASYYETDRMHITHYPLLNKGIGIEFNFQALAFSDPNHAWMGSMEGLVSLSPEEMTDVNIAHLGITDIQVNSSNVRWSDYTNDLSYHNGQLNFPKVTFPSDKNIFEFSYQGISFTPQPNTVYRYKLEGFHDEWLPETKNHSAVFTNLDPGKYTFIVQARNNQSQWKSNEARYQFAIAAPFWQTYWFYSLIALLFGGITYAFVQYRVSQWEKEELQQRVDKQTEHLTEALEEKEVLIKEIHHRVKNNLAVISGLLELQIDHAEHEHAAKVLRDGQQRIQSIAMIHEKLYQSERLAEIDFAKYVEELVEVIVRSHDQQEKKIEVDVETGGVKLGIDQGIPCGLITNELLSNAFEHAFDGKQEGHILVRFKHVDKNQIQLIVKDNGVGLPEEYENLQQKTDTLGLGLISTLVRQLEGEIKVNSLDHGTEFIVEFQKEKPSLKVPVS